MLGFFKRKRFYAPARSLYATCVTSARQPVFYAEYGVPDTIDGRFDMITAHVFAVVFRLKNETSVAGRDAADGLAQALFDVMFKDMERNLREMAVGDLGIPKKVKSMMRSFNGRCYAYTRALAERDLEDAVRRNVFGTVPDIGAGQVRSVTRYVDRAILGMMALPLEALVMGAVTFPAVKEVPYENAA